MFMISVEQFLKSNDIKYILHNHPAVYTCDEAEKYCGNIPGVACKNLFLRDQKCIRYFLVILPAKKQTDFKKFAGLAGVDKVTFADSESLKEKLGLKSGAVSPFGLLNDKNQEVELYIDSEIYNADIVSFHPNVNTASLELTKEMFHKFLQVINHKNNVIDLSAFAENHECKLVDECDIADTLSES